MGQNIFTSQNLNKLKGIIFSEKPIYVPLSIDDLKIVVFWRILETKNIFLLDPDHKPDKKYSPGQSLFIDAVWSALYDEFFLMRDDAKSRALLVEINEEIALLQKINLLIESRNHLEKLYGVIDILPVITYEELKFSSYKTINLTEKKLNFTPFDTVPQALEKIDRAVNSLNNTYNIKNKRNGQGVKKEKENVYKIVADVENVLERQLSNINEMTCTQWLAYEAQAKEKAKNLKQSGNNGKR